MRSIDAEGLGKILLVQHLHPCLAGIAGGLENSQHFLAGRLQKPIGEAGSACAHLMWQLQMHHALLPEKPEPPARLYAA